MNAPRIATRRVEDVQRVTGASASARLAVSFPVAVEGTRPAAGNPRGAWARLSTGFRLGPAQRGRARRDDGPAVTGAPARNSLLQAFRVLDRHRRERSSDKRLLRFGAGARQPGGGIAPERINEGHRPLPGMAEIQRWPRAQVQPRGPLFGAPDPAARRLPERAYAGDRAQAPRGGRCRGREGGSVRRWEEVRS